MMKAQNVYRMIGLIVLIILFGIVLCGSVQYGTFYPLIRFVLVILAVVLITRKFFKKEIRLFKEKRDFSIWILYAKTFLMTAIIYSIISIPHYMVGGPSKDLVRGYAMLIALFGSIGILTKVLRLDRPEYMYRLDKVGMLKFALVVLGSIGICVLVLVGFEALFL